MQQQRTAMHGDAVGAMAVGVVGPGGEVDWAGWDTGRVLASLQATGTVVLRLNAAEDVEVVRRADAAAAALLEDAPLYVRRTAAVLFPELPGQEAGVLGLAGYNEPTVAKAVFRIRRGARQPWPEAADDGDTRLGEFRARQLAALGLLESVADACLHAVDGATADRWQLRAQFGTGADRWDDDASLSLSPYDLFHYYNDACAACQANCHEHVDPGIVTCVPCAATPGLELALRQPTASAAAPTTWWWAPETALRPLQDVVVIAGATLAAVTGEAIPAVVHRVAKAPQSRRSLVYERRPHALWDRLVR